MGMVGVKGKGSPALPLRRHCSYVQYVPGSAPAPQAAAMFTLRPPHFPLAFIGRGSEMLFGARSRCLPLDLDLWPVPFPPLDAVHAQAQSMHGPFTPACGYWFTSPARSISIAQRSESNDRDLPSILYQGRTQEVGYGPTSNFITSC